MNQLKEVFQNLNAESNVNYILADFESFFCDQDGYTRFSLDEEDVPLLKKTISAIKKNDESSRIFVCIYGNELTDKDNKKFIYADSLWILTDLEIQRLSDLFDDLSPEISPSSISTHESVEELVNNGVMLIDDNNSIVCFLDEHGKECLDKLKIIYWD